jgi:rare lipoprotein A (peptidoglycan hydrolase)
MNAILILMATGIIIGAVLPYHAPKYVIQANPAPIEQSVVPAIGGPELSQSTVKASWYGVVEYCEKYNPSCIMANGQKLDDGAFTAACGSRWKVGNIKNGTPGDMISVSYNGKMVIVECTDRGSFEEKYGRQLDLSKAAFSALAPLSKGVIEVEAL